MPPSEVLLKPADFNHHYDKYLLYQVRFGYVGIVKLSCIAPDDPKAYLSIGQLIIQVLSMINVIAA